jgi:hypothetical protein
MEGEKPMMTNEEFKRFRDIRDYASHYQESDVAVLVEHIDDQAKQITVLKAACIHSEAKGMMLQHNEWSRDIKDLSNFLEDAKKQLARAMPDIFRDDVK